MYVTVLAKSTTTHTSNGTMYIHNRAAARTKIYLEKVVVCRLTYGLLFTFLLKAGHEYDIRVMADVTDGYNLVLMKSYVNRDFKLSRDSDELLQLELKRLVVQFVKGGVCDSGVEEG